MLKPAHNYKEKLTPLYREAGYNPKFNYYFSTRWRRSFVLNDDWRSGRDYASVNKAGNVIGLIQYDVDCDIDGASGFGIMCFSDSIPDKITFARDLMKAIDMIFVDFNLKKMGWTVYVGNPIERTYDRECKLMGGRVVGYKRNEARLLFDGKFVDSKMYEVLQEEYLNSEAYLRARKCLDK